MPRITGAFGLQHQDRRALGQLVAFFHQDLGHFLVNVELLTEGLDHFAGLGFVGLMTVAGVTSHAANGFFILNDYYNGINLAYMLDVRGAASSGDDAITDHTMARRVRAKVVEIERQANNLSVRFSPEKRSSQQLAEHRGAIKRLEDELDAVARAELAAGRTSEAELQRANFLSLVTAMELVVPGMVALDLVPPAKRLFTRLTMGRGGRLSRLARGLSL